jgi:hypothetical protein
MNKYTINYFIPTAAERVPDTAAAEAAADDTIVLQ